MSRKRASIVRKRKHSLASRAGENDEQSHKRCGACAYRLRKMSSPRWLLALDLAQVVPQPIFDIPGLVEAARHQSFDSVLGGGSPER